MSGSPVKFLYGGGRSSRVVLATFKRTSEILKDMKLNNHLREKINEKPKKIPGSPPGLGTFKKISFFMEKLLVL